MRRFITLFVCLTLIFSAIAMPVAAVTPRWANTDEVVLAHYNDSGTARYRIKITGREGTTLIDDVDIKLYRIEAGILVLEGWALNLSATGRVFDYSGSVENVLSDCTYRLKYTANVHCGGTVESISGYHDVEY